MVSSPNEEPMAYVVMLGRQPLAAASSLEAAQADAEEGEKRYAMKGESRWDEYRPGKEWRLMSRPEGHRRFAWTQYWVAAVPGLDVTEGGAS